MQDLTSIKRCPLLVRSSLTSSILSDSSENGLPSSSKREFDDCYKNGIATWTWRCHACLSLSLIEFKIDRLTCFPSYQQRKDSVLKIYKGVILTAFQPLWTSISLTMTINTDEITSNTKNVLDYSKKCLTWNFATIFVFRVCLWLCVCMCVCVCICVCVCVYVCVCL